MKKLIVTMLVLVGLGVGLFGGGCSVTSEQIKKNPDKHFYIESSVSCDKLYQNLLSDLNTKFSGLLLGTDYTVSGKCSTDVAELIVERWLYGTVTVIDLQRLDTGNTSVNAYYVWYFSAGLVNIQEMVVQQCFPKQK